MLHIYLDLIMLDEALLKLNVDMMFSGHVFISMAILLLFHPGLLVFLVVVV